MKYFIIVLILIIPLTVTAYTSTQTANGIITSLQTEPEKWLFDQYYLYYFKDKDNLKAAIEMQDTGSPHKLQYIADCLIWISNKAWGIEVKRPVNIPFSEKEKNRIWEIYQEWANKKISVDVFSAEPEPIIVEEKEEQIIKEEPLQLTAVGEDEATPITTEISSAYWKTVAIIEFIILLLGSGILGYINRNKK